MDKRDISAKDIQEYLNLASVQSVYNWCNGINMPTIDNLYALSQEKVFRLEKYLNILK